MRALLSLPAGIAWTLLLMASGRAADAPALPFAANFAGFPSGWTTFGGEWTTEKNVLRVRGGEGPKAILEGLEVTDFRLSVDVRIDSPNAQAGVLFRIGEASPGIDAFAGYYAGIHGNANVVIWGAANGSTWRTIASRPQPVEAGRWYRIGIEASGDNVRLFVDGVPVAEGAWPVFDGVDAAFARGKVGLRALGGAASFRDFSVRANQKPALRASYTNPVRAGAADPVVLHHKGKYYAYCTYTPDFPNMPRGIRLYTSPNLVDWKDEGFVLKNEDSWGNSRFWAPDIVEKDGTFYLYYAADERMCVATAKSPMGPFRQEKMAPIEPASIRIDGHVFEDDDGQRYFYYVSFGDGNEIWGGKLNDDMTSVDPKSLRRMVKPDQPWERHQWPVTEGPEILKHKGTYYLTYSGSHFENSEYAVGYATSDRPLGPWKKYAFNPVMKTTAYAHGTAHHCFTDSPDGKEKFIVYHRHHTLTETEPRQLSIDRVRFVPDPNGGPDVLRILGPTSSPQPLPSGAAPR